MASKTTTKKKAAALERLLVEQAPPGQFEAVLDSIQHLAGELSQSEVQRLARAHWARHGGLARRREEPGGGSVLLHAWAEAETAEATSEGLLYLDPGRQRVVTVNHRTGALVAEADAPAAPAASSSAAVDAGDIQAAAEAVAGYVASQYATEAATSAVYTGSEGVALRVAIYAEKLNLRNFWTGTWLSLWELARGDASGDGDGWVLSGRVTVRAHCFEDGNMQMTTAKPCPPVLLDSSLPLGAAVVAAIGSFEAGLQRSLDAAYAELSEEGLKCVRRKLSLSKQKMEWNAALHRVSRLK